jgi:hypothetical protein
LLYLFTHSLGVVKKQSADVELPHILRFPMEVEPRLDTAKQQVKEAEVERAAGDEVKWVEWEEK